MEDQFPNSQMIMRLCAYSIVMVNLHVLNLMRKNSSLINTARGGLIKNTNIVFKALKENQIKNIFLDVLPEEPPDLNENLYKAWINEEKWISDRIIINPHTSYFSKESFIEMRKKTATNALRIIKNKLPLNIIK